MGVSAVKHVGIVVGALCLLGLSPAAVAGQSATVTEVTHANDCTEVEFTTELGEPGVARTCFNSTTVFHSTDHPDGTFTVTTNSQSTARFTVTIGGVVTESGSNRSQEHIHLLVDDDGPQVTHQLNSFTFRTADITCTETAVFHAANGEVQISRFDSGCRPSQT